MIRNDLPTFGAIYRILNLINGRIYIGSTINLKRRNREHYKSLLKNKHCNKFLQNDFNKCGAENFVFEYFGHEIFCKGLCSKEFILQREQLFLDGIKQNEDVECYNICMTAGNSLGRKISQETKDKWSKNRKGKTIGAENPMYGKKHTIETREKMSKNRIKKTGSEHHLFGKIRETRKFIATNIISGNVKTYINTQQAAKELKYNSGSIWRCLNGKLKKVKEWKFEYVS